MRIGKSSEIIPSHYGQFFGGLGSGEIFSKDVFSNNLRILLHRDSFIDSGRPSIDYSATKGDEILVCQGREEAIKFLDRLKMLLKWGNFFWRLSDLSVLKLEAKRVIKPSETDQPIALKIHWNLELNNKSKEEPSSYYYIDGEDVKMGLKSLYNVQRYRLMRPAIEARQENKILYSGISRYVFSSATGLCKELHVERIEPKISGIDWKWKLPTNNDPAFE